MRLFLTCAALVLATAGEAAPPSDADRAALEALAEAADIDWNEKDVAGMAAHYAQDASLGLGAQMLEGRAALADYFKLAFARRPGVFRHVTRIEKVELLRPDLAFSDAVVRVERQQPDGSWALERSFRNASVSVRSEGGWKLRSVRAYPVPG